MAVLYTRKHVPFALGALIAQTVAYQGHGGDHLRALLHLRRAVPLLLSVLLRGAKTPLREARTDTHYSPSQRSLLLLTTHDTR